MFSNVGALDRIVRLALASVLFYFGLMVYSGTALSIGLLVAGTMATVSGAVGFCGLYRVFGISTRRSAPTPQS